MATTSTSGLPKEKLDELRKKGYALDPIIRVGKSGLTGAIVDEIKNHLRKRKLIKVKLLKGAIEGFDKKKLFEDLVSRTGAVLVHKVGFTVVLYKR